MQVNLVTSAFWGLFIPIIFRIVLLRVKQTLWTQDKNETYIRRSEDV